MVTSIVRHALVLCLLFIFGILSTLQAQNLDGVFSDGQLLDEGSAAVAASIDLDNEGLFIRGRYGLSFGELFGGIGFYDKGTGTHIYMGLERTHTEFSVSDDVNLQTYYQLGFSFRQADLVTTDYTSTTLRGSYLARYSVDQNLSVYSGLTLAFVIQSYEILNNLGVSNDNDIQITLPIGARYKIDDAGKMNVFSELGLISSSGGGYFQAGFRYAL